MDVSKGDVGILLPNNQRQHRTLHIQKDVLSYALCWLLLGRVGAQLLELVGRDGHRPW